MVHADLLSSLARAPAASGLSPDDWDRVRSVYPARITSYYTSLIDPEDPEDPIARMALPDARELDPYPDLTEDPLDESAYMPVDGLLHRYPDRVLFLATRSCAVNCRFCTRKRFFGSPRPSPLQSCELEAAASYVERHPEVREVIISGGDPLTLADDELEALLSRFSSLPNVEVIRLGSRVPAVMPERITQNLAGMMSRYGPLYFMTHFNHTRELTPQAEEALGLLSDRGIPLANQTVLLSGINDDLDLLAALCSRLQCARVRPYYLHQCDLVLGTGHFRTPLSRGLDLVEGLRVRLGGLAVPFFAVDLPNGGGKVAMSRSRIVSCLGRVKHIRNYRNELFPYPDL